MPVVVSISKQLESKENVLVTTLHIKLQQMRWTSKKQAVEYKRVLRALFQPIYCEQEEKEFLLIVRLLTQKKLHEET